MKEISDENYNAMIKIRDYYVENIKDYNKLNLDSKQIFNLRRKIKNEKNQGFDNILRTITLYTHTKDIHLKMYVNKLYLEYFKN